MILKLFLGPGTKSSYETFKNLKGIPFNNNHNNNDVRVCHPNAESYQDLTLQQIYRQHENEKKRMYASRVMEVKKATFTPLVFATTGGMAPECQIYHKQLAKLLSAKKDEDYSTTMSWIRTRISFAILRTSLLCLRGSRSMRRVNLNLKEMDFDIERGL